MPAQKQCPSADFARQERVTCNAEQSQAEGRPPISQDNIFSLSCGFCVNMRGCGTS